MSDFVVVRGEALPSPARREPAVRGLLRVGAVQTRWHADRATHREALAEGIRLAAHHGARLVCLQ